MALGWERAREYTKLLERAHAKSRTRGDLHCSWRADGYDSYVKSKDPNKRKTRRLFVMAMKASMQERKEVGERSRVLLLDAEKASSSRAIRAGCGTELSDIFVPNVCSSVVHQLRTRGVHAWFGDVKDLLKQWDRRWGSFDGVWLDYCCGVSKRTQDIEGVFSNGVITRGGILALAFSSQDSSLSSKQSIKPIDLCVKTVLDSAKRYEYHLEPACINAKSSERIDGDEFALEPALGFPSLYRYKGIYFLITKVS